MTFDGAGGEIDQLARGLDTLDSTLDALCAKLRDLNVQDTGPVEAAQAYDDALSRLERGLGGVGAQARESAFVVRRFTGEGDT